MNAILVEQMAKHRIDTFNREAAGDRRLALVPGTPARPVRFRERFDRTAGRLRLILQGSAA